MFLTLEKDENHMLTYKIIFFYHGAAKGYAKKYGEG